MLIAFDYCDIHEYKSKNVVWVAIYRVFSEVGVSIYVARSTSFIIDKIERDRYIRQLLYR